MASIAASLSLLLLLLFLLLPHASSVTGRVDCSAVQCPRPLCANPVVPEGECCGTCENSNCMFKGCVNILPDGEVRWAESRCIHCKCNMARNQKSCYTIDCSFFPTKKQCFGRPVIYRPNECCPTCDFGIPSRRCGLVPQPFGRKNLTIGASDTKKTCTKEVINRVCDKIGFRAGNKRFRCLEVKGKSLVRFDEDCPMSVGAYRDTVRCEAVRDDDMIVGCDFVVP